MRHKIIMLYWISLLIPFSIIAANKNDLHNKTKIFDVSELDKLELKIKVDVADFKIDKNSNPGEIKITASYDADEFSLTTDFDEKDEELQIDFDKDGFWDEWDGEKNDGITAELEIFLPNDIEIMLNIKVKVGEIDFNLGDLKISEFRCKNWVGEVSINFDEPNRIKMEYFDLNTKIGSTSLHKLGNARFMDADIDCGTGELDVDFTGSLLPTSVATLDLDIGETTVTLSEHVGIELVLSKFWFLSEVSVPEGFKKSGRRYYNRAYKKSSEGLHLKINQGIGSLDFKIR